MFSSWARSLVDDSIPSKIPVYRRGMVVKIRLLKTKRKRSTMKKIEAVIKPFKLEDVKVALTALGIQGLRAAERSHGNLSRQ
jgi:hypothetical protein